MTPAMYDTEFLQAAVLLMRMAALPVNTCSTEHLQTHLKDELDCFAVMAFFAHPCLQGPRVVLPIHIPMLL